MLDNFFSLNGSENLPYELLSRTSSLTLIITFLSSILKKSKIYEIEFTKQKSCK